ncbi:MAG: imidazole glycerol phosphate synthase subunit HisH [Planctomycetia bacterium]|uniref:Imidazole glycerol phosphate synthase subunit HisH n=1 Tax=Candidatus Brocadia sapporoensis TaxID=392547 RepID=A0A1V6LXT1_9BACT|nr:imidazole glycerol phosphate synthase subunit HisH [Candidatus Brocadia sapporoensis]MCC7239693.1 imidazole glycerol phosphate synthase subunit HisH [Candidatus Brocadia sp.]QOJ06357.1 MAG: imidazole glycerol phosphate synthase subunit HisH [Planctomycetia bacterium]TVL95184.1 MAG: imidazole glycerol phosphate synthase subunit HisH [Candidatus Brocadia sp. BL1]MDG6004907.1 imidazole glycerol phosphate synthase subunit HisH [Candidatus Brocadia sp.]OQD44959.1 imidazole glycerol phosphate syn
MIVIVDYGMGNLRSVEKAFERFGFPVKVTDNPSEVIHAEKLVLPGVGAFRDAMDGLRQRGLIEPVKNSIRSGKPFLGICLGLQLLFSKGYEDGEHEGLNIISGKVVRFDFPENKTNGRLKIPHMGWNQISFMKKRIPILSNVPNNVYMYFVHSYYVCPDDESVIATKTEYGVCFTSMIWYKNIYATQFHPEKSQEFGLTLLKNFGNL